MPTGGKRDVLAAVAGRTIVAAQWNLRPADRFAGLRSGPSAGAESITIAPTDGSFNDRLRWSDVLQVRGEGTLRVPPDGSSAALVRLDACYQKNSHDSTETNRFVAHSRKS